MENVSVKIKITQLPDVVKVHLFSSKSEEEKKLHFWDAAERGSGCLLLITDDKQTMQC